MPNTFRSYKGKKKGTIHVLKAKRNMKDKCYDFRGYKQRVLDIFKV